MLRETAPIAAWTFTQTPRGWAPPLRRDDRSWWGETNSNRTFSHPLGLRRRCGRALIK